MSREHGGRVDPSDGGGADQTTIMRAMQQQFERMNVVFNEIRDRLDRHEDRLEQLQQEPLPRHRRPDQQPHFAPNVPDDDYDDGASNEVISNATWRRARAIRPERPRHVQRQYREREAIDSNMGLQVEMYVPNHEEHEEDLHVPAELIMKTEVKQVQHAVQALTSRHQDTVSTVAFSFDGQLLATGSFDGHVHIWDTSSGSLKFTLEGSGEGFEWLKWHPRGHLLIAGSEDANVWMWNADKGVCLNTFSGHGSTVTCGDFTPDGKIICTGSDDASLRIWNPKTGECFHVVKGHPYHTDGLTCLSITSDSTIAITGAKDGSVHLVNITIGRVISSLSSHTASVECIGLKPNALWATTGGMDLKLIIWDLQSSSVRCTCDHEEGVTSLTWLGTSQYVASGCVDGKVRIWDSLSGGCVRTFSGHADTIQSLAISADGNSLVSVSDDGTARVFSISEFK
ncbi:hypothetical protein ZIOFF_062103 [Zingiber officinale]|uniref:Angio-associated migratory cell protein n=1 Tax=Zingiber officinale TaxID=94328 RepID=A0A8J5F4S1_ZINOF|nr:hypothetical protein ZIOFF_062103 [Zingiber officinale]